MLAYRKGRKALILRKKKKDEDNSSSTHCDKTKHLAERLRACASIIAQEVHSKINTQNLACLVRYMQAS